MGIFSFFGKTKTFPKEISLYEAPPSSWDKFPLGVDRKGKTLSWEPNKNPNLLVVDKSVSGELAILETLLTREPSMLEVVLSHAVLHPDKWEAFAIDTVKGKFSKYENFSPVVLGAARNFEEAQEILQYVVEEVDKRHRKMELARVNHIAELPDDFKYLLVVIDGLAELLQEDKPLEKTLESIVLLGPAAGVHCVLATQQHKTVSGNLWDNIFTKLIMGSLDYTAIGRGYYQIRNQDGIEFQSYQPSFAILQSRFTEQGVHADAPSKFVFPSRERQLVKDKELSSIREQRILKFEAQIEEMYKSGELDPDAEGGFAGFDHAGFPIWVGPRPTPKDNKEATPETENGQNV